MKIKYFITFAIQFIMTILVYKIGYHEGLYESRHFKTRYEAPLTRATELPSFFDIHD